LARHVVAAEIAYNFNAITLLPHGKMFRTLPHIAL
jgi:hypothetical protein